MGEKKIKSVLEIEKLDKTLQSLHLDVIASQQKHKVELAQLEQQITQLERDFTDARKLYSHKKDQAIRKRDDLLRKSEVDFLQAREGIKGKVAEVEHLDSVVKKLKATQELASQDEKLLLMESSLKATQEQLSEQIAGTVRQERNSRKSQS
ncbi:hypothetical protein Q9966_013710 [Columba livia]|nr:hypothetical protein Q9966_013710 [Columba livia]